VARLHASESARGEKLPQARVQNLEIAVHVVLSRNGTWKPDRVRITRHAGSSPQRSHEMRPSSVLATARAAKSEWFGVLQNAGEPSVAHRAACKRSGSSLRQKGARSGAAIGLCYFYSVKEIADSAVDIRGIDEKANAQGTRFRAIVSPDAFIGTFKLPRVSRVRERVTKAAVSRRCSIGTMACGVGACLGLRKPSVKYSSRKITRTRHR